MQSNINMATSAIKIFRSFITVLRLIKPLHHHQIVTKLIKRLFIRVSFQIKFYTGIWDGQGAKLCNSVNNFKHNSLSKNVPTNASSTKLEMSFFF